MFVAQSRDKGIEGLHDFVSFLLSCGWECGAHVLVAQQFHTAGQRVNGTDDFSIEKNEIGYHHHQHPFCYIKNDGTDAERQPHQSGKHTDNDECKQQEVMLYLHVLF